MLQHPTHDRLKAPRLDGMAEAFAELQTQDRAADLTHAEWLGLLADREEASRETKRYDTRMRAARLRHLGACPEDVDYRARRGLDKALFQSLLTGKWITDKRNLIITGPCGVGKTWLGCALAQAACRDGVTGALQAHAAPLRRSGTGPWRWPLPQALPQHHQNPVVDPRRLGAGPAHRTAAP